MSSAVGRPGGRAVCVYCASSRTSHSDYRAAAQRLGEVLATAGIEIVYGGGAVGSMGALADGALGKGGRVIGILPRFMAELEWGHRGLTELELVEDLRVRKHLMLSRSDAAIALPGGSGTLEELLEAITLKRLGLYLNPIVRILRAAPLAARARGGGALHGHAASGDVAGRRASRGRPRGARARAGVVGRGAPLRGAVKPVGD
jgi:uncharacterized protein (TIGR00730 family)